MHITVSCCQKNTWADFFEKVLLMPQMRHAIFNERSVKMLVSPFSFFVNYLLCYIFIWFFFQLVPTALEVASQEDLEFRKALPKDYLNYMGVAFSDSVSNLSVQTKVRVPEHKKMTPTEDLRSLILEMRSIYQLVQICWLNTMLYFQLRCPTSGAATCLLTLVSRRNIGFPWYKITANFFFAPKKSELRNILTKMRFRRF